MHKILTCLLIVGILIIMVPSVIAESDFIDGYQQGIIDIILSLDTPHMDKIIEVDTIDTNEYDKGYVYGAYEILGVIEQAVTDISDVKTCDTNVGNSLSSMWEQMSRDSYLTGIEALQLLTYIEFIYPPDPIDTPQYDCESGYNENYSKYEQLCSSASNVIWVYRNSSLTEDDKAYFQTLFTDVADWYKTVTDYRRLVITYYLLYGIQGGEGFAVSP